MPFHHTQLANGLTIIGEDNPAALSTAVGFFVRTGARDESSDVSGVSHFLEHMVFKGTPKRTALDVNKDFDRIGAQYNAYTSEENTVFWAAILPEYLPRAVDILADILRPSLREDDFSMEKNVIIEEIGMYDDDPLGRLGYLKFQLFRANRCVVDTGIHHYRWTREQAIARFVDGDGEAPGFTKREVERYFVTPGQACAYKLGQSVFLGIRDKAKAAFGNRFDIKDFHSTVIGCGRVPLEILQQVGDKWIATARA